MVCSLTRTAPGARSAPPSPRTSPASYGCSEAALAPGSLGGLSCSSACSVDSCVSGSSRSAASIAALRAGDRVRPKTLRARRRTRSRQGQQRVCPVLLLRQLTEARRCPHARRPPSLWWWAAAAGLPPGEARGRPKALLQRLSMMSLSPQLVPPTFTERANGYVGCAGRRNVQAHDFEIFVDRPEQF